MSPKTYTWHRSQKDRDRIADWFRSKDIDPGNLTQEWTAEQNDRDHVELHFHGVISVPNEEFDEIFLVNEPDE